MIDHFGLSPCSDGFFDRAIVSIVIAGALPYLFIRGPFRRDHLVLDFMGGEADQLGEVRNGNERWRVHRFDPTLIKLD